VTWPLASLRHTNYCLGRISTPLMPLSARDA
jgi:hypothetical protein